MIKFLKFENHWKPLIAYSVFYILFFSPVWAAGHLIAPEDDISQNLAAMVSQRTLWTPLIWAGFPVFAEPQFMTFYPLSLFCLIPWGWNIFVIGAFVMAAFFMYAFTESLTKVRKAAALAGIIYPTTAFFVIEIVHIQSIHQLMWLPCILLSLKKLHDSSRPFWFSICAFATALCALGGHPQNFVYSIGLCVAFACYLVFLAEGRKLPLRKSASNLLKLLLPMVLGVGVSSVAYVPTMELVEMSNRLRLTKEIFDSFCIFPICLPVYLFFPWLLGGRAGNIYGVNYWGPPGVAFPHAFIGLMPIVLILVANSSKPLRRPVIFWTVCAIVSVLFSFGSATPVGGALLYMPVYKQFRAPHKHLLGLIVCASVLSAYAIKAIQEKTVSRKQLCWSIAFVVMSMLLVFVCICSCSADLAKIANHAGNSISGFLPWQNAATLVPLVIMVLVSTALLFFQSRANSKVALVFLFTTIIFDLSSFAWFTLWRTDSSSPERLVCPSTLESYKATLLKSQTRLLPPRGRSGTLLEAPPNESWTWGMPSISGHSALLTSRMHDLFAMGEGGFVLRKSAAEFGSALDITCVRYVFLPKPRISQYGYFCSDKKVADRWKQVGDLGDVIVYENQNVFPHYWLVSKLAILEPEQILKSILENKLPDGSAFDPHHVALLEEECPAQLAASHNPGSVRLITQSDTELELQVSSETTQMLVLSDSWYPGWEAKIDERPAKIFRADYMLRGIVVPPGQHRVLLSYKPFSLVVGILLSLVAMAGIAVFSWMLKRFPLDHPEHCV